jgi:hypothetical protein
MSPRANRKLLVAPELFVVDLADANLRALLRAIRVEHPDLRRDSAPDDPTVLLRRARAILRPALELRRALAEYRRAVDALVDDLHRDDLPF